MTRSEAWIHFAAAALINHPSLPAAQLADALLQQAMERGHVPDFCESDFVPSTRTREEQARLGVIAEINNCLQPVLELLHPDGNPMNDETMRDARAGFDRVRGLLKKLER